MGSLTQHDRALPDAVPLMSLTGFLPALEWRRRWRPQVGEHGADEPLAESRLTTRMAKTFLRRAYDELVGMSEIIMASGLDWTIARFLAPKDGPAKGTIRHGFYGADKLRFNVTREDIAAFTAAQVDDDRYIGAAPAISN
jgi:hypothetical protein